MYVLARTNNPRPTFHVDMTPEERALMERHVAYWSAYAERGIAVAFGPVMDPSGAYGVGIYRVDDLDHMRRLLARDPALGLLQYDVFEMPQVVMGRPAPGTAGATGEGETGRDFRAASGSKQLPKAAVDGVAGIILAFADVDGTPEETFRALTTDEVEAWWSLPGVYRQRDWRADLRPGGAWSVAVEMVDGGVVHAWGEFCELDPPRKIVMTRRFDAHPFLGERETTLTSRFEPSPHGTRVTVRDEGFVGRAQAAYGNAEIWEKVLGWLDGHLSARRRSAT